VRKDDTKSQIFTNYKIISHEFYADDREHRKQTQQSDYIILLAMRRVIMLLY